MLEDFSAYCTANVTSCRVTVTELYDATDDVLNVFDELCTETDLVSMRRYTCMHVYSFIAHPCSLKTLNLSALKHGIESY